jgi:acyl carrier protein
VNRIKPCEAAAKENVSVRDTDERLQAIFRGVFSLSSDADVSRCRQVAMPEWDSLAHVTLVAAIESEFGVSVDTADSLGLTSYESARLYLEELGV